MAAITLFIFSLLVSTTFAINEHLQNAQVIEKEERPAFQALPLQPELGADKTKFNFHVYYHEIFEGPNKTTVSVISPNGDNFPSFGKILVMDVPLWDSLSQNKIIARAQGPAFQASLKTYGWHLSYNFVFETEELKGSTLQVLGQALELTGPRQWSIVGGTGKYTLAQGQVYGRRLSSPDDSLWIELKISGYYTPMQQPPWK